MKQVSLKKLRSNGMTFKLPMRHVDKYSDTPLILSDTKKFSEKYTRFSVEINVDDFVESSAETREKTKIFICPVCHKSFAIDIRKATALLLEEDDFHNMDKELRKKILTRLYYSSYILFVAILFSLVVGGFGLAFFSLFVIPKEITSEILNDITDEQIHFFMFFLPVLIAALSALLYYIKLRFLTLPCDLLLFIEKNDPVLYQYNQDKHIYNLARSLMIREITERHFIHDDAAMVFDRHIKDLNMHKIYDFRDVKKLDIKQA